MLVGARNGSESRRVGLALFDEQMWEHIGGLVPKKGVLDRWSWNYQTEKVYVVRNVYDMFLGLGTS